MTLHANIGPKVDYGHVAKLDQLGLLSPDLQLIHMIASTPAEIDAVGEGRMLRQLFTLHRDADWVRYRSTEPVSR